MPCVLSFEEPYRVIIDWSKIPLKDEFICNYDVTKYGSCMIDDVLFDMLDDYNFDMLYDNSFEMIFWNYYHSFKKGLCWPSVWDYLLFDIRSAQSIKAIFDALRFEMIYDFHLQMSRKIFVHKIIFVRNYWRNLLTKILHFNYFSYTAFCARLGPHPCV